MRQSLKAAAYLLLVGSVLCLVGLVAVPDTRARDDSSFHPHSYNDRRKVDDGNIVAEFFSRSINYLDETGQWQPIDLTPVSDAAGFHITRAPYELHLPTRTSRELRFAATNRYDPFSHQVVADEPITKTRTFASATDVAGQITEEGILYAGAFADADLLIKPSEEKVQYLVKFSRFPDACLTANTVDVPMHMTFNGGVVPRDAQGQPIRSARSLDSFIVKTTDRRAISTPPGRIWDSAPVPKENTVSFIAEWSAPTLTLTKTIPCDFFKDVVYPVYTDDTDTFFPDPNTESTSVDGRVGYFNGETWDTSHDATSATDVTDSATSLYAMNDAAPFTGIYRSLILFDTSSIPDTASIQSATFSAYVTAVTNLDNDGQDYISVVASTPASNTAVVAEDYDQVGATDNPTKLSNDIDIGSLTTSAYNAFTLNSSGLAAVSKTGVTKLGLRLGHDQEDAAVTANNRVTMSAADETGTSQDPKLTVTWQAPDLQITKTGSPTVESGSTISYTLTATNNGPQTVTGILLTDVTPAGFVFAGSQSSSDCTLSGANVVCGTFQLAASASTGRTVAFDVRLGTGGVRTNTATITGSISEIDEQNNSGSILTTVSAATFPTKVRKVADEIVTNSTTIQDDADLRLTLLANKTYIVQGAIFATSTGVGPDIKIAFAAPSGTTMDVGYTSVSDSSTRAAVLETSLAESSQIPIQANKITLINVQGTLVVGSSGGDFRLWWAQDSSNSNSTRVKEGSFLFLTEIP